MTGLLFGLAPAMYAFRATPANALRQIGRGGDTWFWRLFGKGLVAAQVALSIFLVTGTAVFLAHLSRLRNFDLGFRSDHVLLMTLDPDHSSYKSDPLAAPYQRLLERLQSDSRSTVGIHHRLHAAPGLRERQPLSERRRICRSSRTSACAQRSTLSRRVISRP